MMTIKAGGRELEVATNLGASLALQQKFNKNIPQIFENIENYNIDSLISLLYTGVKLKNPQLTEAEFKDILLSDDNFSYMTLTREVLVFMRSCMSVEKSEVEVRAFVDKYINRSENIIGEEAEILLEDTKNTKKTKN